MGWAGKHRAEGVESSGSLSQANVSPCPIYQLCCSGQDSQLKLHFSKTGTRHQVAVDSKSQSRKARAPLFPVHSASFHLVCMNKHPLIYSGPQGSSQVTVLSSGAHNLTGASSGSMWDLKDLGRRAGWEKSRAVGCAPKARLVVPSASDSSTLCTLASLGKVFWSGGQSACTFRLSLQHTARSK